MNIRNCMCTLCTLLEPKPSLVESEHLPAAVDIVLLTDSSLSHVEAITQRKNSKLQSKTGKQGL